jgi:tetratricopeptide (TPR) repeat protein
MQLHRLKHAIPSTGAWTTLRASVAAMCLSMATLGAPAAYAQAPSDPEAPAAEEAPRELTQEEAEALEAVEAFRNLIPPPKREGPSPYALVNDADPEGTVPLGLQKTNPMGFAYYFMELTDKAETAVAEKRFADAVKYQRAMIKSSPEDALGYRKLCATYAAMGDREQALNACSTALASQGTMIEDAVRFVDVAMTTPGELSPSLREEIDTVIAHVASQPEGALPAAQLQCRLGARLEAPARLRTCVQTLTQAAPDSPVTITYAWALALAEDDSAAAERLAKRAEQLQLPPELAEQMRAYAAQRQGLAKKIWIGMGSVAGLLVLLGAWRFGRQRRPNQAAHA